MLQEETEDRVREQVLARPIDEPCDTDPLQRVPYHERIHVRGMRRRANERTGPGEACDLIDRPTDDQPPVEILALETFEKEAWERCG